jgi:hypothetical protein
MKKATKFLLSVFMVLTPFVFPVLALAETGTLETNIDLRPTEYSNISNMQFPTMVAGLVKFVLVVAALVFFFVLVIGGIQWIMSGGDKTGAETARKRITAALVGLAIVFAAWAIGTLIKTLFGFDIFNLSFTPFF